MNYLGLVLLGFSLIGSSVQQGEKEPFTFDDFMNGRFSASGYGGVWVSDAEIQLRDGSGNIVLWNVTTDDNSIVVPAQVLSDSKAQSYVFSSDRKFLLISYDTQAQFRHSTTARFTVYSLNDGTFTPIADSALLQTAAWGPNGRSLLYVLDNDLWYTADVSSVAPTRITTSGVPGVIYNAVPDWVYEEEVLAASTAYWFSPDGSGLVYLEFNDTLVPEITYLHYGTPGTLEGQYPSEVTIRYPKTGRRNPSHTAYYVDLTSAFLNPTPIRSDDEGAVISYGFAWNSNTQFVELIMNRVQNESTLALCDVGGSCSSVLDRQTRGGWDRSGLPYFDSTGENFLAIESVSVGSLGSFSHLVLRKTAGSAPAVLTSGAFVVLSIIGWDEQSDAIYYTANVEGSPSNTHVYRVSSAGSDSVCITCDLVTPEGNPCTSGSARFSSGYSYVILTCSGPDPTTIALYSNGLPLGAPMTILQSNSNLRNYIKTKLVPTRFDRKVAVPGGYEAEVRLLLPPNFDENSKYPLLINVYGGPDSNQISEGFFGGWDSYLTTNLSVIYGFIDGRGSGRKGDAMMFAGYRNLGTVEISDQINVTRTLQQELPWIDSERSAIWGWSYGGYATGRTLEMDTEGVFKCGISVAPVTSWLYYDSIYTERYMGLPTEEDNLSGYQFGDLVSHVDNLKTKKYYLIHGNADDNVHYQQSMLLSRALELDDVLFQQQSYPDENHSLGGVSRHLYHSMDTFWKNCFEIE